MKVVMLNQKGGVGKTAITINLGYGLVMAGKKCLMIDCDAQANLSKIYCPEYEDVPVAIHHVLLDKKDNIRKAIYPAKVNSEEVPNLFILPSNQDLISATEQVFLRSHREKLLDRQLVKVESEFDFILIDCSPTINVISKNAMLTADVFLIPTDTGPDSLDGMGKLLNEIDEVREGKLFEFQVIRNMCQKSATRSASYIDMELAAIKNNVFTATIRRLEKINQARMGRVPIQVYDPKGPGADDYKNFIIEFLGKYDA